MERIDVCCFICGLGKRRGHWLKWTRAALIGSLRSSLRLFNECFVKARDWDLNYIC